MKTIYKYPIDLRALAIDGSLMLLVPDDAEVLYAVAQRDDVVVYAFLDPTHPVTGGKRIWVIGTGHLVEFRVPVKPLGVCALRDGALMLHIFLEIAS